MVIEPDTSSTILKRATIIDDFPAPVLHVTKTPINRARGTARSDLPPNNAYLFASLDGHAEALKDERKLRAIPQNRIFDLQLPLAGPRSSRFFFRNFVRWLLFKFLGVVDDTLNRVHVVLDFRQLPDHPIACLEYSRPSDSGEWRKSNLHTYLLYGEYTREREADLRWRDSKPCADGQRRYGQGQQHPENVKP
jgi:hypothetical protein